MGTGRHAIIIGAGLAGSLLAAALGREGWRVSVFERRSDPRRKGYIGGRSINLAVSARGIAGLAFAGLDKEILGSEAIAMPGRMIHAVDGKLTFQPYSKNPSDAINSFSRGGLNLALINAAAREPGVSFFFDHPCLDIDFAAPAAFLQTPTGGLRVGADLIIGTDGAFSAVRAAMQKTDRFEYSQSYLGHGYKELHIPAAGRAEGAGGAGGGAFAMDPHALHIWPRGGSMMIALPNRDGSFTNTLFWPFEGFAELEGGVAARRAGDPGAAPTAEERERVRAFFAANYGDAVPLMPTLVDDFFANPTSSLVTVRCFPWQRGGKVVLLGDAAHAIVPFYGQGMNAAFEDVVSLVTLLRGADQAGALEAFQAERKPNADAIADMALENFVEMRDKTGRPEFLYRKKVEQAIHGLFEGRWTPQYNLVSFSTVPYVEARRRGRELDAVVDRVVERVPRERGGAAGEEQWRAEVKAAVEETAGATGETAAGAGRGVSGGGERHAGILLDITPAISARLGVWPGDTPPTREVLCDIASGDTVTLSTLRATVHLGAHADGPNHYGLGAPDISRQGLEHYVGACQVIEARVGRGQRVTPGDLSIPLAAIRHPRMLIKTGTFPDPEHWNADFAALSVELVDALAARGVITIGIDTPSVDLQESKDLQAHNAILKHGIAILEGLALREVAAGEYELIALPLRLEGFDASPVRAVLRARM